MGGVNGMLVVGVGWSQLGWYGICPDLMADGRWRRSLSKVRTWRGGFLFTYLGRKQMEGVGFARKEGNSGTVANFLC